GDGERDADSCSPTDREDAGYPFATNRRTTDGAGRESECVRHGLGQPGQQDLSQAGRPLVRQDEERSIHERERRDSGRLSRIETNSERTMKRRKRQIRHPRVKYLGRRGGLSAWIVDGSYVRKNIDEEFSNFGHHYSFNEIPKG